jgi:hypothetical protein
MNKRIEFHETHRITYKPNYDFSETFESKKNVL